MSSYRKMLGLLALGALISTYGAQEARAQNFSGIQSRIDFLSALIQQQDATIQSQLLQQQANLQSITPTNGRQANQIANRLAIIQTQLDNPPLPPAARQILRLDTSILNMIRSINSQLSRLAAFIPRSPGKAQQQANRVNVLLAERTNLLVFNQEIDAALARNAATAFRAL